MLIVIVAVAIVASVPLVGGRYRALSLFRLRGTPLVAGALVIQIAIISVLNIHSETVSRTLHITTYVLIGVCLALNRTIRWMWLVTIGWLCNLTVIVANGGVMPTSTSAAHALGRTASANTFENSAPAAHAKLAFLGDIIPTPHALPMANILSIGDLLLLTGLALIVYSTSRTPTQDSYLALA